MQETLLAEIRNAPILIADDHELNRTVIIACLQAAGFMNLRTVRDGAEALAHIKDSPPDLLILDIMMPGIDGLEVCRRLRDRSLGFDSTLPILIQSGAEGTIGRAKIFLAGASDIIGKPFNPGELAARVSLLIQNRQLLRGLVEYQARTLEELEAARRMQAGLLPTRDAQRELTSRTGLDLGSFTANSSEIGGDLWGISTLHDGTIGFYIVDFSGHGVAAAMNVFRLHTLISEVRPSSDEPASLLGALNRRLVKLLPRGQFATMLYCAVDPRRGQISYASAGAPRPLFRARHGAQPCMLESSGLPLGISDDAVYVTRHLEIAEGGFMFLYSDGLTDLRDGDGRRIGEGRAIANFLELSPIPGAQQRIDALCARLVPTNLAALPDDLTLALLSW